jgi:hypothetical protein
LLKFAMRCIVRLVILGILLGVPESASEAQNLQVIQEPPVGRLAETQVSRQTLLGKINVGGGLSTHGLRLLLLLGNGEQLTEFVRLDGTFTFRDVQEGLHVLEVFHVGFMFPQIRLEISGAELDQNVRASYIGLGNQMLPYPLVIQPMGKVNYFEPRQKFSLRSFIFQPQIMMMLFMIGGLVLLPKMAIDPEQMQELKKEMYGEGSQTQQQQQSTAARSPQVKHRKD